MKEKVKRWSGWMLCVAVAALTGCKSSETAEGAAGKTAADVFGGTAVGGTAGACISRKMAERRVELDVVLPRKRAIETARKGEAVKVTFDSGLLFLKNASTLCDTAKYILRQLAACVNRYPDTDLRIACYTDSAGDAELNLILSERRARGVRDYLEAQGVAASRMTFQGMGALHPAADNRTPSGRAQNRRLEIWLLAGEQMLLEAQLQKK
ncbi:MAG: OmpA family protein [Tannerella sp.]|jgi:outer membrane protein OmpA-like peptidoglycan-associated protein|nr:OmpA family protein [Tannerella sp.]